MIGLAAIETSSIHGERCGVSAREVSETCSLESTRVVSSVSVLKNANGKNDRVVQI